MSSEASLTKRLALAHIAREEAALALSGDASLAGEAIEKYLTVFREAMNRNGDCGTYSDLSVGYPWCCAFVYYCCLRAGFSFPPKPVPEHRWTLAAVRAWYEWAAAPGNDFYFPADDPRRSPAAGDLVLYDRLLEDTELDHLGVVVAVQGSVLTTAEGNVHNRSGLFQRPVATHVNGYVRLNE